MAFNVPLHFASGSGKYQGVVWNGQAAAQGCGLWLKQQHIFAASGQALLLSREIVTARLQHIRETLRLRQQSSHMGQLETLIKKLPSATTLAELNGLEGSATRVYFLALRELVPAEFNFDGLNKTARNLYLAKLVAKFDSKLSAKNSTGPQTLFTHIHQQNLSLILFLEQGAVFTAWRIR